MQPIWSCYTALSLIGFQLWNVAPYGVKKLFKMFSVMDLKAQKRSAIPGC